MDEANKYLNFLIGLARYLSLWLIPAMLLRVIGKMSVFNVHHITFYWAVAFLSTNLLLHKSKTASSECEFLLLQNLHENSLMETQLVNSQCSTRRGQIRIIGLDMCVLLKCSINPSKVIES